MIPLYETTSFKNICPRRIGLFSNDSYILYESQKKYTDFFYIYLIFSVAVVIKRAVSKIWLK